ncbi:hypothetical protein ACHAWX_003734 [Stephanocyclus meneghinianus]
MTHHRRILSIPLIYQLATRCHLICSFYLPSKPNDKLRHRHRLPASLTHTYASGVDVDAPSSSIINRNNVSTSQLLKQVDELLDHSSSPKLDPIQILNSIDQEHERDLLWAKESLLPFEKTDCSITENSKGICNPIEYDIFMSVEKGVISNLHGIHRRPIALRTKKSTPLLNAREIQVLISATESYWDDLLVSAESSCSRFTYQRKGNSEAHLADIVKFSQNNLEPQTGRDVTALVDELLLKRVYPWIREAFLSNEQDIDTNDLRLYVYDSLFIRYNGTEANIDAGQSRHHNRIGAGQPLHRDLGYVSVNIMLNNPDEFEGGGTFFEQQLLSCDTWNDTRFNATSPCPGPLLPLGAGHALAHLSSDRHAGAATTEGVRDILVIFIAVAEMDQKRFDRSQSTILTRRRPPRWDRAARLKTTSRSYCYECFASDNDPENRLIDQLTCRIYHHRLAIDAVPHDGEAWQYLGMALLEHANIQICSTPHTSFAHDSTLDLAIKFLEEGTKYTPCDARLYNNIGIAWETKLSSSNAADESNLQYIHAKIISAYQRAVTINSICLRVGCDVISDFERACLNFGLYLSKQDDFHAAIDVLERIDYMPTDLTSTNSGGISPPRQRVLEDARGLLLFCKKQTLKS